MPRPQKFNEIQVIETSMHLFWSQGYVATGISQILEANELKPGSFYNAFPSKKDLFIRSLKHYQEHVVAKRITSHLETKGDPIDAIEKFLLSSFEPLLKRQIIGCLLTNTATELGKLDPDIGKVVWAGLSQIEAAFKCRIIEAQELGIVDPKADSDALALHLLTCLQGMAVVARVTQSKAKLRSIAQTTLSILR